jgi:hypothetical protein
MHPAAEWGSLTGSWQLQRQDCLWDQEPRLGRLPQELGERLAQALGLSTRRADRCFFAVWDGWGTPSAIILFEQGTPEAEQRQAYERADAEIRAQSGFLDGAPAFTVPHRGMRLLEGPLRAISAFYENHRDPPSLWWPEDRAWCVATDVAGAVARATGRGWRLDKSSRGVQIDGVVALAMAVERAQFKPEPVRLLGWA